MSGQAEGTRQSLWSRVMLRQCVFGLGGGFEGDVVSHRDQLGDVVADLRSVLIRVAW